MPGPRKIVLACDESGAKGYADRDEAYPGEVGVFAGILIPDGVSAEMFPVFQALIDKYKPATGKLHIADLSNDKKEEIRTDMYGLILKSALPCFWYAIHVAGLNRQFNEAQGAQKKVLDAVVDARDGEKPRVKRGSPRTNPPSMHVELFNGLFAHLVAFLAERGLKEVEVEIRLDQIDQSILDSFEEAALRLLNYGTEPLVTRSSGYDTVTERLVHGKITIEAHLPPELHIDVEITKLTFNPMSTDDGLVLAADVLANSLYYLFKNRTVDDLYKQLNRPSAVARHPLAQSLDAFWSWGGKDLIGDCLYHHPKDPELLNR